MGDSGTWEPSNPLFIVAFRIYTNTPVQFLGIYSNRVSFIFEMVDELSRGSFLAEERGRRIWKYAPHNSPSGLRGLSFF
jgi:hypothetical protein